MWSKSIIEAIIGDEEKVRWYHWEKQCSKKKYYLSCNGEWFWRNRICTIDDRMLQLAHDNYDFHRRITASDETYFRLNRPVLGSLVTFLSIKVDSLVCNLVRKNHWTGFLSKWKRCIFLMSSFWLHWHMVFTRLCHIAYSQGYNEITKRSLSTTNYFKTW